VGYEEAALRLRCPVGTIKSRLARGRERLRACLTRRGLAPPLGSLAMNAPAFMIPRVIRDATARAAIQIKTTGAPTVGTFSAATTALMEGTLRSMLIGRLKVACACTILALAGVGSSASVAISRTVGDEGSKPALIRASRRTTLNPPVVARSGHNLISKIEYRGRKAVRLAEIETATGLRIGNVTDPERAQSAVHRIHDLYHEKGYGLASVTLLEGGGLTDTHVVFEIFEGPKIKVNSISFKGNYFATEAQLHAKIAASKPIPAGVNSDWSGVLDESRQKVVEYYQSQGFFEASVTPVTRPSAEPGKIDVTFAISEGPRYKVRSVVITGNTLLKTEALRAGLELQGGKPFTREANLADRKLMLLEYLEIDAGQVKIDCEPRFVNERGTIDLLYRIEENPAP
jgi:hypothetical protein